MFARTQRLFLRPGWPEDAPALAAAIGHESVVTRLSRVPWPYTLDHAADWLSRARGVNDVALLVFDQPSARPRLIGACGLHVEDGDIELGYWYTPDAWGCGYATEAGRAMVGIARHALGARRLASRYHADNPASGNVLRKLGFVPTGRTAAVPSLAQGCAVHSVLVEMDLIEAPARHEVAAIAA